MSSITSSVLLRRHPKNSGGGAQDGGLTELYPVPDFAQRSRAGSCLSRCDCGIYTSFETREGAMRGLAVAFVGLTVAASSAAADTKTFLSAPFTCAAGYPTPTITRSTERHYYDFTGSIETKSYMVCQKTGGAWRENQDFGDGDCRKFGLASFKLACWGGLVSAPALTLGLQSMGLFGKDSALHLQG